MANVSQTRQGKFQVKIRLKGFPPVIRSFELEGDAIKWGEKEESRLKRERAFGPALVVEKKQTTCTVTLRDLIERYITEVTSNRRTQRAVETQTYELKAFLREPFCGKLLTDLSLTDFNGYVITRMKRCQKRTIKRQLSVIRNALDIGNKRWGFPSDPNWITELGFKAKKSSRQRRLEEGELESLWQACERIGQNFRKDPVKITPRIMRLLIQSALLTSMRQGELLAMEWKNVRFRENYIHVPETKTNEKRDVPLLPELAALLKAFQPERISNELVFPFHFSAVDSAWGRLCQRAKITGLNFHDLRHEALSRLSEGGVMPVELMMFSGHKSLDQLTIYCHGSRQAVLSKFTNEKSLLT